MKKTGLQFSLLLIFLSGFDTKFILHSLKKELGNVSKCNQRSRTIHISTDINTYTICDRDLITGSCGSQLRSLPKTAPSDTGVHRSGSWAVKVDVEYGKAWTAGMHKRQLKPMRKTNNPSCSI